MKKLLVLFIILTIFLSGCNSVFDLNDYIYNLGNFTLPDDKEFIQTIESLDTLDKICNYMNDNFIPIEYNENVFDPYTMWQVKTGDCNDYASFAIFCANYHNYETYQIWLIFPDFSHIIAVYKIDNGYLVSDWDYLHEKVYNSFSEIMQFFYCKNYIVYDYNMNIIEQVT